MEENLKHLLLKDLCARLPYGVKVQHQHQDYLEEVQTVEHISRKYGEIETNSVLGFADDFKPYLRPMSSMTEEEKNYIDHRWGADNYGNITTYSSYEGGVSEIELADIVGFQDWLNKNMFDYRGLIEKNLALDCTGLHIYD